MKIDILTLFPEMFAPLFASVTGRAAKTGILELNAVNIRGFTNDKHGRCDDYTFGGGEGMLMTPQRLCDALNHADPKRTARRIYMSPRGRLLTVEKAKELAELPHIVILCGHYEGVDQRVIDNYIDEEISIGDFILTGGELPAMILADCVARFVTGVLGNSASAEYESFNGGLLEFPQYTRPSDFNGIPVPPVLLSGDHEKIRGWRLKEQIKITKKNRPDLYKKYVKEHKNDK